MITGISLHNFSIIYEHVLQYFQLWWTQGNFDLLSQKIFVLFPEADHIVLDILWRVTDHELSR